MYFVLQIESKPKVFLDKRELTAYEWVDADSIDRMTEGTYSKYTMNAWKRAKIHLPKRLDILLWRRNKKTTEGSYFIEFAVDKNGKIPQMSVCSTDINDNNDNIECVKLVKDKFGLSENFTYKVTHDGSFHKIWVDVTCEKEKNVTLMLRKFEFKLVCLGDRNNNSEGPLL